MLKEIMKDLGAVTGQFTGNYVYSVFVDGEKKYIGRGVGLRYMHPLSGKSSCALLNRDFFKGRLIQVVCTHNNLSKRHAVSIEAEMIGYLVYLALHDGEEVYNKQVPTHS